MWFSSGIIFLQRITFSWPCCSFLLPTTQPWLPFLADTSNFRVCAQRTWCSCSRPGEIGSGISAWNLNLFSDHGRVGKYFGFSRAQLLTHCRSAKGTLLVPCPLTSYTLNTPTSLWFWGVQLHWWNKEHASPSPPWPWQGGIGSRHNLISKPSLNKIQFKALNPKCGQEEISPFFSL